MTISFPSDKELGALEVFKHELMQTFITCSTSIDNQEGLQKNTINAFLPLLLQRTFEHSKYALASVINENSCAKLNRKKIHDAYPILEAKITNIFQSWTQNTNKILNRWQKDKAEIAQVLFKTADIGDIEDLSSQKGDEHQNGEQSLIFNLSCGRKICYKPRCLKIEKSFYDFAAQLGFDELYQVSYVVKDSYGWMEYIPHTSCTETSQLETYYFRSGLLLSLLYILEAEDIHHENVIAFGDQPVIIDLETLFHHRDDSVSDKNKTQTSKQLELGNHTVLKTHFIPQYFNMDAEQEMAAIFPVYDKEVPIKNSIPLYNNSPIPVNEYIEQFIEGFSQGYRRILANKKQLSGTESPLKLFESCTARYISRSTHIYVRLIKASQHLSQQKSLDKANNLFDKLAIDADDRGFLKTLINAEKKSLLAGEIPRFTHKLSSKSILIHNKTISSSYFSHSGLELCQDKLKHISEKDLLGQINIIRYSFNLIKPKHTFPVFNLNNNDDCKTVFAEHAKSIGIFIIQQHIEHLNGGIWPVYKTNGFGQTCLDPTNNSFYNGSIGIHLFIAHLQNIFPEVIAREALISNSQILMLQAINKKDNNIGMSGSGGTLYVLNHLIHLWPEVKWPEQYANKIVDSLNMLKTEEHDIISGSAGAILALLSFYQQSKQQSTIDVAINLGHKLSNYCKDLVDMDTNNANQANLSGFAHGIAGIGYALIKLADVTNIKKFETVGLSVLETESKEFCDEINNWPDKRFESNSQQNQEAMSAWCHGAIGISLSRLKLQKILNQRTPEFINQDIDRGLSLIRQKNLQEDCLCHGNFGNYELNLSAIELEKTTDVHFSELYSLIKQRMQSITDKGVNHPKQVPMINLAFMTGWSGLGYQLLRFAYPEKIPNILLLDSFRK